MHCEMTQSTASWETITLANEINGFAVLKCHSVLGLLVGVFVVCALGREDLWLTCSVFAD